MSEARDEGGEVDINISVTGATLKTAKGYARIRQVVLSQGDRIAIFKNPPDLSNSLTGQDTRQDPPLKAIFPESVDEGTIHIQLSGGRSLKSNKNKGLAEGSIQASFLLRMLHSQYGNIVVPVTDTHTGAEGSVMIRLELRNGEQAVPHEQFLTEKQLSYAKAPIEEECQCTFGQGGGYLCECEGVAPEKEQMTPQCAEPLSTDTLCDQINVSEECERVPELQPVVECETSEYEYEDDEEMLALSAPPEVLGIEGPAQMLSLEGPPEYPALEGPQEVGALTVHNVTPISACSPSEQSMLAQAESRTTRDRFASFVHGIERAFHKGKKRKALFSKMSIKDESRHPYAKISPEKAAAALEIATQCAYVAPAFRYYSSMLIDPRRDSCVADYRRQVLKRLAHSCAEAVAMHKLGLGSSAVREPAPYEIATPLNERFKIEQQATTEGHTQEMAKNTERIAIPGPSKDAYQSMQISSNAAAEEDLDGRDAPMLSKNAPLRRANLLAVSQRGRQFDVNPLTGLRVPKTRKWKPEKYEKIGPEKKRLEKLEEIAPKDKKQWKKIRRMAKIAAQAAAVEPSYHQYVREKNTILRHRKAILSYWAHEVTPEARRMHQIWETRRAKAHVLAAEVKQYYEIRPRQHWTNYTGSHIREYEGADQEQQWVDACSPPSTNDWVPVA